VALQLKRRGIARVRPLHGGLTVWIDRKFPVTEVKLMPAEVK
jgi:3-mercaptopyruvate sulfurtransferase SseA